MNFSKMNMVQLNAYAKENGIDVSEAKTKAEKVAVIAEASTQDAETVHVTAMGVEVDVDPSKFNDFDVFELLGEVQSGNVFVYPKLVKILFGEDWPRIYGELKGDSATLSATTAILFFQEVMEQAGAKN